MRLFIGIEIPDQLKSKIVKIQKRFRDFDIKFVEKDNLHFCLKFLGEVPDQEVDNIKQIMSETSKKFEKFSIKIKGMGVFPSKTYIRVIWLGVENGKMLEAIASELNNSLKTKDRFTAHLTLGRVRSGRNREELVKLIESLDSEIGEMEVDKICLIQSVLSGRGPIYKEIFSSEL
ncbi:MAG: RNA 2',3'-cyclic phosphodiesterase [Candidatus Hodarchaeales archaeon]|jgi:2'-5' RNA ligase